MKPNAKTQDFFFAIACNDSAVVAEMLHDDRELIHCRDPYDNTPLIDAAERGQTKIVKLLLELGADPAERNQHWRPLETTALPHAFRRLPAWDAADLLLVHGAPDDIFVAAENDDSEAVRDILADNPDLVDDRDEVGNTALFLAAWRGYPDVVRCLLEAGADPNAVCQGSHTPLSIALDHLGAGQHYMAAKLLAEFGGIDPEGRKLGRRQPSPVIAPK